MNCNIILFRQETREFLVKHLENKNGEGRNYGSQHEERMSFKGFVFSSTRPHNKPIQFINVPLSKSRPKFLGEQREELEIHNENISRVEDKHVEYLTLNEECRRDLAFKESSLVHT